MSSINDQLVALTFIEAVDNENQELMDSIVSTISSSDLAVAVANVASTLGYALSQFTEPEEVNSLHKILNRLRELLVAQNEQ